MASLSKSEYRELDAELRAIFHSYGPLIEKSYLQEILHFLDHAELEMAFELFCLFLITNSISLEATPRAGLLRVGRQLGLNVESVYDPDFWTRLEDWVASPETS